VRLLLRISGEILVTLGVLILGFGAYLYWGTAQGERNAQHSLGRELQSEWAGPEQLAALTGPGDLQLGRPFAVLRIPQFGSVWREVVVQGVSARQLALGPGHVPGTAMPGQLGNFAVAAHRVTAGNLFWHLPSLRSGSMIDVETINGIYEYEVTGPPRWVAPGYGAALDPVPYYPGEPARQKMITLITSDPLWTGTRVAVTGVLVRTLPRQGG
jgi:sortase A